MVRRDSGFHTLLTQEDVGRRVILIRSLNHEWYRPDDDIVVKSVNRPGNRAMVGRSSERTAYSMSHQDIVLVIQ